MSIHAKPIGIALLAIGTLNSSTVLVSRDDDKMEPWHRRGAALERVWAVDDWDELERSGWKTKEAQAASFRRVTARVILHNNFIFGWTHAGLLNSDFSRIHSTPAGIPQTALHIADFEWTPRSDDNLLENWEHWQPLKVVFPIHIEEA